MNKPKLSSTVSVVKISDKVIEFFKTNTRQQVRLKVQDEVLLNVVLSLDGTKEIEQIAEDFNVNVESLKKLIAFLKSKGIIDNVEKKQEFEKYEKFRRVIHFLADYSSSHEELINMWDNIRTSTVLIVGLGAVGSWVTMNLVQSGVEKIIVMDKDLVELSNIHRQFGYYEDDIGLKKIDVIEKRIKEFNKDVNVTKVDKFLNEDTLEMFNDTKIDLIINCADKPNVDTTSYWIGKYAMKKGIPHIIGGGYNLHLSLIGQTVIPGKTACVNCFKKTLDDENKIDSTKVKKLAVKNRKVGSFGPMCTLIASMIGMESIKVLSKNITPSNINRRGEFNIYTMDFQYKNYERRDDCEWCGSKGIYYNSKCKRE